MKRTVLLSLTALIIAGAAMATDVYSEFDFIMGVLKFQGGGDWYSCLNAVRNEMRFISRETQLRVSLREKVVQLSDNDLFLYPFIMINGHGNLFFDDAEAAKLRQYLTSGGFLFCNDDYGIDSFFRREMKKVFPELDFVELPFTHEIYHCYYDFPNGLPKVHEHEGKPSQGFGLIYNGRLVSFYAFESDIVDGWEAPDVYHDPEEIRTAAMRMGANIVYYAMTH